MAILNITVVEISNITYTNAFAIAVAKSMSINPLYIAYQNFSALRRRLASSIFELTFQITLPVPSNASSSALNATLIVSNLIGKYYDAVNAGDTLQYAKKQLIASGVSAISFLILPVGQVLTISPTFSPTINFISSKTATSSNNLIVLLAAPFGSVFIALLCIGAVVVSRRRRAQGSNLAKKYIPITRPVVDEEMSIGSIYSPKSDREDGFFSLNVENLRTLQNGEEFKSTENHATASRGMTVTLKKIQHSI